MVIVNCIIIVGVSSSHLALTEPYYALFRTLSFSLFGYGLTLLYNFLESISAR